MQVHCFQLCSPHFRHFSGKQSVCPTFCWFHCVSAATVGVVSLHTEWNRKQPPCAVCKLFCVWPRPKDGPTVIISKWLWAVNCTRVSHGKSVATVASVLHAMFLWVRWLVRTFNWRAKLYFILTVICYLYTPQITICPYLDITLSLVFNAQQFAGAWCRHSHIEKQQLFF